MIKQTTFKELLADFPQADIDRVWERSGRLGATHVVLFQNVDLCSSQLGRQTALLVGPGLTYNTVEECEGKWLNDLPSQRQYPQSYAVIPQNGE